MNNVLRNTSSPVRKRSGYRRDFNVWDVFVLNVFGYSIGLAISVNPAFVSAFSPAAELWLVVMLGAGLAFFNGIVYGYFGGLYPNTGGDYVYIGRSLGPGFGFVASWGFTVAQTFGLATNLLLLLSGGVAPALVTCGRAFSAPAVEQLGLLELQPFTQAAIGTILLALVTLFVLSGLSLNRFFLYPLFFLGMLSTIIMAATFLTFSHEDFVRLLNSFVNEHEQVKDAYHAALTAAVQHGASLSTPATFQAALTALPIGFIFFVGFNYSVYLGGEVREPLKSQSKGILFALLLGVVAFTFILSRFTIVVGRDFQNAVALGTPVLNAAKISSNSLSFFAGVLLRGHPWINLVLQIGNLVWFALVPVMIFQVCLRNVIAWSLDDLFPAYMLRRSTKTLVPWIAILFIAAITELWLVINLIFGFSIVGASALIALTFVGTGLSAVLFPSRHPDRFAAAPALVRRATFPHMPDFVLAGFLSMIGCGWIVYVAIKIDGVNYGSTTQPLIYIAVVYALGGALYSYHFKRLKRRFAGTTGSPKKYLQEPPLD